jgi:Family of unknown function (DUF6364)
METKLTLKFDAEIIKWAKEYAQKHGISLSKMMEQYFRTKKMQEEIAQKDMGEFEIDPFVQSLSGIINPKIADNYKDEIADYLIEKYYEK